MVYGYNLLYSANLILNVIYRDFILCELNLYDLGSSI